MNGRIQDVDIPRLGLLQIHTQHTYILEYLLSGPQLLVLSLSSEHWDRSTQLDLPSVWDPRHQPSTADNLWNPGNWPYLHILLGGSGRLPGSDRGLFCDSSCVDVA